MSSLLTGSVREPFEQLALVVRETRRHLDRDLDALVAPANTRAAPDPLSLDAQNGPGLCPRGDAKLSLAIECQHLDLASKRSLGERDRDRAQDIVSVAPEERMGPDMDDDLEIPRRAVGSWSVARTADDAARA